MYSDYKSADWPPLPKTFKSSRIYFNISETKLQEEDTKIIIFSLWNKKLGLFSHNSLHTALSSLQFLIHSIALSTPSSLGTQAHMCSEAGLKVTSEVPASHF